MLGFCIVGYGMLFSLFLFFCYTTIILVRPLLGKRWEKIKHILRFNVLWALLAAFIMAVFLVIISFSNVSCDTSASIEIISILISFPVSFLITKRLLRTIVTSNKSLYLLEWFAIMIYFASAVLFIVPFVSSW